MIILIPIIKSTTINNGCLGILTGSGSTENPDGLKNGHNPIGASRPSPV